MQIGTALPELAGRVVAVPEPDAPVCGPVHRGAGLRALLKGMADLAEIAGCTLDATDRAHVLVDVCWRRRFGRAAASRGSSTP